MVSYFGGQLVVATFSYTAMLRSLSDNVPYAMASEEIETSPSLLDGIDWNRYVDPDLFDLGLDARQFMHDDQEEEALSEAMNLFKLGADVPEFSGVSKLPNEPLEIPEFPPVPEHGDNASEGTGAASRKFGDPLNEDYLAKLQQNAVAEIAREQTR